MKYFWTDGGNNRPYFSYRICVPKCTNEMYLWCEAYPDEGKYFRRWHVEWGTSYEDRAYDIVQFEWERAAIDFTLRWV